FSGRKAALGPRPDARTFERGRASVNAERRLEMVVVVVAQRIDHADVVDHLADVREEVARIDAALAARFELPHREAELALALKQTVILRIVNQLGLVIE